MEFLKMATFDVMNIPNSGTADSDHSFEEVQSMESRMESHLITLSAMITDRESAWDEMDSFDIRQASASPSPLSSLTFGTDKSPGSHNTLNTRFRPLTADGNLGRRRCREDSGTVCSEFSSPSPPMHDHETKDVEIATPGNGRGSTCNSGCPSTLSTPVVFEPRKWLMESPNLNSLRIESSEESIGSIIHEIASSRGLEPCHAEVASPTRVEEDAAEPEETAAQTASNRVDMTNFPEFHEADAPKPTAECPSSQSLMSIPDPNDPLLSYYFTHFPHMFAAAPAPPHAPPSLTPAPHCCAYPTQVTATAGGFEHLPPQHMQFNPPPQLSQLQEPIVINVPNQPTDYPSFHSASSCSILSSSFEMHPPALPNDGHPYLSSDGGGRYHPDDQQPPPPSVVISMTQPNVGIPQQLPPAQLPYPAPMQVSAQHQPRIPAFPQPIHAPTFVDAAGNIMTPVSGAPALVFPPAADAALQQMIPAAALPNPTVVGAPVVCANDQVVLPQYLSDLTRVIQPQPPPQSMQPPFMVSMNMPQSTMPTPVVAAPQSAPPPPPPPSIPQPAQIVMAQQPVMPIHPMPQQSNGSMFPVFNPVQMIAVDVPAVPGPSMPVAIDPSPLAQRPATGVRPLMEIKEDEKNSAKKSVAKAGCVFCRSNGEREREYMGHRLKNPITNVVECPQLRKFVCPICGATGDSAHTVSYCPSNSKWTGSTVKHLKAMRSSAGKKCGRNVARTIE